MVDFQPLVDMVVVKPLDVRRKETASGLAIPETEQPQLREGTVVAIGEGAYTSGGVRMPPDFRVGDTVYYTGVVPYFRHFDNETSTEYHLVRTAAIIGFRPSSRRVT